MKDEQLKLGEEESTLEWHIGKKLKRNNNFKCPECGGNLMYWMELTATAYYPLTKDNTRINKFPKGKINLESCNDPEGFICSKCGWCCSEIDEVDDTGRILSYHQFA